MKTEIKNACRLRHAFLMLQQLPKHQQDDARGAQEAREQAGDQVDLESDARVGGQQIQQPQADEAGNGVDRQLPQASDLGQQQLDHQQADHHRDRKGKNRFHVFPP